MTRASAGKRIVDAAGRDHGPKGNRGVPYRPVLHAAHLRRLGACERAVTRFIAAYPSGALVDSDTARAAVAAGFNLQWLVNEVTPPVRRDALRCYCKSCFQVHPERYSDAAVRVRLWLARYNQGLV